MRLLRRGLRVIAVTLLAVAVGEVVNQIRNGGRWNLRWLAAAVVLAVLAESVDLWPGTRDSARGPGDAAGSVSKIYRATQLILWRTLLNVRLPSTKKIA